MFETTIFLTPIVFGIYTAITIIFFGEKSAHAELTKLRAIGIKRFVFWPPYRYLILAAYSLSILYIPFGWAWLTFAVIMLLSSIPSLFADYSKWEIPETTHEEIQKRRVKRLKSLIPKLVLLILWLLSWMEA